MFVSNKNVFKIQMGILCGMLLLAHFWKEIIQNDTESLVLNLKTKFNEHFENISEERKKLLKIIINNYEHLKYSIKNKDIFTFDINLLQRIVDDIDIKQTVLFCKYSFKMFACSLGPIFITILSFIVK